MLRIAICDDEVNAREAIYMQLEKILWEGEEIVYEFSSGNAAVRWLSNHPGEIDLLFLDVEMEGMNGMETAWAIREFDRNLILVFVTGYREYVFDGYSVGAMDYLMKPVNTDRLQNLMQRVRKAQYREREEMYILKNTEGTYRFPFKDISYFYSDRRQVVLVVGEREYPFYQKLDRVQEELEGRKQAHFDCSFVRIHQRYLVNARLVEYIGSNAVIVAGKELPISRGLKEKAVKELARAMLEGR